MTRPTLEVIDDIQEALRRLEVTHVTLSWQEFYKLNKMERFKTDRREQLVTRALQKGIILGFGDDAVIACKDRNFAPIDW